MNANMKLLMGVVAVLIFYKGFEGLLDTYLVGFSNITLMVFGGVLAIFFGFKLLK